MVFRDNFDIKVFHNAFFQVALLSMSVNKYEMWNIIS